MSYCVGNNLHTCISNSINKTFLPLTDVPVSDQMYFLHNHVTVDMLKGRANTASDSTPMARSTVNLIGRSEFGEGVVRYKIWADIMPGNQVLKVAISKG